ncbi:MAG: hypothetical protein LBG46_06970, partial [Elusimicrobiota bacterium]|nr:hypothetical protein [Elusimicrobiota bacterium]
DLNYFKKTAAKTYVAVDALLGLGANNAYPARAVFQEIIDIINGCANIISIDGPTGVDMDSGLPYLARAVKAKETYALGFMKKGLILPHSAQYAGKLTVLDIFSDVARDAK